MLCLRCNPNSTQWCEWTGAQIFRQNHTRIKKTKKPSNRVTVLPLRRKKIPKELKEKKYYEVIAITETKVYTPLKALMISFLIKVIIFFKSTKCTRWCENDIGLLHLFHYYELTNWRFSCVCPVIDNESTATLTMSWRNSLSITGQTHEKLTSICFLQ